MKKFLTVSFLILSVAIADAQPGKSKVKPVTPAAIKSANDSLSYSIGVQVANYFKSQGIDKLNLNLVSKAMADIYQTKPLSLNVEDANKCVQGEMMKLNQVRNLKMQQEMAAKAGPEREKGAKFLAENKTREGVIELPSGLQYKVITMGTGAKPVDGQNVKVHYHGTLIDGTVFDSSVDRGQPATFNVNQLIAGWTEALKLMPVGSKWKLYVPSKLAYGDRAMGDKIAPGATLIFDIELLDIVQ